MARRPKTDPEGQAPAAVPPGEGENPGGAAAALLPGAAGRRAISVTGPAGGRWRAGRHFGPEPAVLAPDAIGPAAEAAIRADPRLVVAETVLPAG